jgi:hypothetical protein
MLRTKEANAHRIRGGIAFIYLSLWSFAHTLYENTLTSAAFFKATGAFPVLYAAQKGAAEMLDSAKLPSINHCAAAGPLFLPRRGASDNTDRRKRKIGRTTHPI